MDISNHGRIFDFHVRITDRPDATAALLSALDSAGVGRAAVAAGGVVGLERLSAQLVDGSYVETDADNELAREACAGSDGRLTPFYFGNPHRDAAAYRDQVAEFAGLELSPAVHGVGLLDRRTAGLVEVAAEAGHPIYLVCLGRPGSRTADLVTLASWFPEAAFVLGHCGYYGIDLAGLNRIADSANIVAETSGSFAVTVRHAIARLGADRVLFGSEYPLQHPAVELAKFESLELDDDTWQQVAWHNAHRLLGKETT